MQSTKRGNKVNATRKIKKMDQIKTALDGKEFDVPVDGFKNRKWTRLLLVTINFDRSQFLGFQNYFISIEAHHFNAADFYQQE